MSIRPAENSTLDIRHVIGIGTLKAVDLGRRRHRAPDRARELGSLSKAELGKLGLHCSIWHQRRRAVESIDDKLAAEALHAMDPSAAATFLEALTPTTPPTSCANSRPSVEALLTLLPLERAMVPWFVELAETAPRPMPER